MLHVSLLMAVEDSASKQFEFFKKLIKWSILLILLKLSYLHVRVSKIAESATNHY